MSTTEQQGPRVVVGCMTGTSLDGLDVALVHLHGGQLNMAAECVRGVTRELGSLGVGLRALAEQKPMTAGEIARLSRDFALLHAEAVREVVGTPEPATRFTRGGKPMLIAVHGQTVFHEPPLSWQMFNGAVLAHELRTRVVFDLRAADLAAGGQGAPITPLADWVMFRSERPTAVINLGGFCNVTLLPADVLLADGRPPTRNIEGFDVCACNHLLDRIARETLGRPYDEDGLSAMAGKTDQPALEDLRDALAAQAGARRSLGTGDETGRWVDHWRGRIGPRDLAATACAGIAGAIARRIDDAISERLGAVESFFLAGGGARNRGLVRALQGALRGTVQTTAARGVPIEFREAAAMGVLGALCLDRVRITLPQVTGVSDRAPVAGTWAGLFF